MDLNRSYSSEIAASIQRNERIPNTTSHVRKAQQRFTKLTAKRRGKKEFKFTLWGTEFFLVSVHSLGGEKAIAFQNSRLDVEARHEFANRSDLEEPVATRFLGRIGNVVAVEIA